MTMKNRYSTHQAIENRLRAEVSRETPDEKNRILAAVRAHEERSIPAAHRRPVMKYAVSFALVAVVLCGALTFPKVFGPSAQPAKAPAAGTKTASASQNTETLAQQNPFVLKAYAAENTAGSSSQSSKSFGLSLGRRISVSGIDCFANRYGIIYNTSGTLNDDGKTITTANYYGFNLKCVGDRIKTVTYTADRGGFAQVKSLTREEFLATSNTIPYFVEQIKKQYADKTFRKNILAKDPNCKFVVPTPNLNYGDGKSMEIAGTGWGIDEKHVEYDGFLPVGKSYTLGYKDQDDYTKQYVLRVVSSVSSKDEDANIKAVGHAGLKAMAGTVVTVTATYEDGSTASKQVVLKLDKEYGTLSAVEK